MKEGTPDAGSFHRHHKKPNIVSRHSRRGRWAAEHHPMRKFARAGYRRPKYNVPVNIREHETGYEAQVFCVGYPKESIDVSVVGDMLYISGTRTPEGDPNPDFLLQEFPIKSFERSFELSHKVDKTGIRAKVDNGILTITVPKTESARDEEQKIIID
jgi:HSP20 family protein